MTLPRLHALEYKNSEWVCPVSERPIPKAMMPHLDYRDKVYRLSDRGNRTKDAADLRGLLLYVSKHSPLFWINTFVWTFLVRKFGPDGRLLKRSEFTQHIPFISWPVQDDAILTLIDCIENGEDVLIDKSRDMGASWILVILAVWYWLFVDDAQVGFLGRIEDDVDKAGNPKSLFWKIDYVIRHLPDWMLPCPLHELQSGGKYRKYLIIQNPQNRAVIRGEATTDHLFRGDRLTWIAFDEFAAHEHGEAGWTAATDSTACKIANSTPIGPGTMYSQLWKQGVMHGHPKIVQLGYWDHPDKGLGREARTDEDGEITNMAGRQFWWTPWFEEERKRRTQQDLAQNVLIDHISSGSTFFNAAIVSSHMQTHGQDPLRCELVDVEYFDKVKNCTVKAMGFAPTENGRWFVFCELDEYGRPHQETVYIGFADPSHGKGAANSAVAFLDTLTNRIVAEFVDPNIGTFDLADEIIDAGRKVFAGDEEECMIGWEVNGPGEEWNRDFKRKGYTNLYRQRSVGRKHESRNKDYGWRSDKRRKRVLLNDLNRALVRGGIEIPSKPGLSEMLEYVVYDDGSIGPGHLVDETTGARESHGDRVIAYAGCVMLSREAAVLKDKPKPDFPTGSWGDKLGHRDVLANTNKGGEHEW